MLSCLWLHTLSASRTISGRGARCTGALAEALSLLTGTLAEALALTSAGAHALPLTLCAAITTAHGTLSVVAKAVARGIYEVIANTVARGISEIRAALSKALALAAAGAHAASLALCTAIATSFAISGLSVPLTASCAATVARTLAQASALPLLSLLLHYRFVLLRRLGLRKGDPGHRKSGKSNYQ